MTPLPRTPRTIALGLVLLAGAVTARAEAPAGWEIASRREVAPGLRYSRLERGEVQRGSRLDLVVGASASQAQADRIVAQAERAGFTPSVVYGSGRYEVRVVGLPDRPAAERARAALAAGALGMEATLVESGHDLASPLGPWVVHLLEADPESIRVRVAHARDASFGLERTGELAHRHGALAAVNGGFYRVAGALAGEATGSLVISGQLHSEPDRGRGSVGFVEENGRTRAIFGRPTWCATATLASGDQIALDGIDRHREAGEAILYTPEFHRSTLTGPGGVEAVAVAGRIVEVRRGLGGARIPERGFVLSLGPERIEEDGIELRAGEPVTLELRLEPRRGDPGGGWERAHSIVSAGPLLLAGGTAVGRPELESISRVFGLARHPRTAAAARADGTLLLVAVEGRRPESSVGMSLPELTALLAALGAVDGVNLDGGGSTAMVVGGELVTRPSDQEGERANGDALLLFAAAGR